MTFFASKIDHSDDFIGQIYLDKRFNGYDIYTFCEENIRIYHYPVYTEYDNKMNQDIIGDKYVVSEMVYDNSKGCTVGTQLTYGTFDNIDDAVECGRDVLTDVALSQVA
jgi:hypothetical protein